MKAIFFFHLFGFPPFNITPKKKSLSLLLPTSTLLSLLPLVCSVLGSCLSFRTQRFGVRDDLLVIVKTWVLVFQSIEIHTPP